MNVRKLIVSGLGAGYLPASGTWGSLGPCLVFAAVARWAAPEPWVLTAAMAALAVLASAACVALGRFAERAYGKKDPRQCTIDEWAGQAVTLLACPAGGAVWASLVVGFLAFRFFDIVKPFPARRMEKLPYGWGVLVDDLFAGVYANVATQLIVRLWVMPNGWLGSGT